VKEPKVGKVRIHVDVLVDDLEAAVESIVALGGSVIGARVGRGETDERTPLTCPRGPRSGADVGRQVLAGEGGAAGDEGGGCALEHDPAAVVAAGAEVDDPVGVRHDRLVVLDDDDRLAGVDEPV
jgi:hypothetical protein